MSRLPFLAPEATPAPLGFAPLPFYGHPAFAEHFGFSGPKGLSVFPESAPEGLATGLVTPEVTKGTDSVPFSISPEVFSCSGLARLNKVRRIRRLGRAVSAKSRAVRGSTPAGFRWTGAFVTLTYARLGAWHPDDINRYLRVLRSFFRRRRVCYRYVWVAELQERGAVHYHLVVWWSSAAGRAFRLPKPDSCGWWPHGQSNIRRLRSAGESYLAKYVSKGDSGAFPKGLRLYGMDRDPADSLAVHRACLPAWLARACPTGRVDRVPVKGNLVSGGGYRSRDTGARFFSPLVLVRVPLGLSFVFRFVPAIRRSASCLDCIFAVLRARTSVPGHWFGVSPF